MIWFTVWGFLLHHPRVLVKFSKLLIGHEHLPLKLPATLPKAQDPGGWRIQKATQHTKVTGCYSQIEDTVQNFWTTICCMVLGVYNILYNPETALSPISKTKMNRSQDLPKKKKTPQRMCSWALHNWSNLQNHWILGPTDFGGFRCLFAVTMLSFVLRPWNPKTPKNGFHYGNSPKKNCPKPPKIYVFLCGSWWSNPAPSRSSPLFSIAPA